MRKLLLSFVILTNLSLSSNAQLANQATATVIDIVENTLIGAGTLISNVTSNGAGPNSVHPGIQTFTNSGGAFPFSSGVILRTDGAPSVNLDPDLNSLGPTNVTNGVILEFDFVATGDTMNFSYIFASSEYSGFTCTSFNDVFGFFLSGPGISGPYSLGAVNIATIPGTTIPVGINTINSGIPANNATCLAANPNYMSDNIYFTTTYNTVLDPIGGGYNGATVALIAASGLTCNETYHVKLGIANSADEALQSAVFLEAESFQVFGYEIGVEPSVIGPMTDSLYAEGCVSSTLVITRNLESGDSLEVCIPLEWQGTVDPFVDLQNWPDSICFDAGEDTVYLEFDPVFDNVPEVDEWITMTLTAVNICGVEIETNLTLWITDDYFFDYDLPASQTVLCRGGTTQTGVTNIVGSVGPFTYSWSPGGETTPNITMTGGQNPQDIIPYTVSVTDLCGQTIEQTTNLIVNQTISIDSIMLVQPADCEPVGIVSPFISGASNPPNYIFEWEYLEDPSFVFADAGPQTNLSGGTYVLTLIDDNIPCSVTDTIFVPTIPDPIANATVNPETGCSPLLVTFTNTTQNAVEYVWDFGNGNVQTVNNTNSISQTYTNNATITLSATNGNPACDDEITLTVQVVTCGCTNPIALNYNEMAVIDDNSCILPVPEIVVPNVFTPNGDDINSAFEIATSNAQKIEFVVVNRWGNLIFEGEGTPAASPKWDGKDRSGNPVEDGVYFYNYKVTGIANDVFEGHGFVQVTR